MHSNFSSNSSDRSQSDIDYKEKSEDQIFWQKIETHFANPIKDSFSGFEYTFKKEERLGSKEVRLRSEYDLTFLFNDIKSSIVINVIMPRKNIDDLIIDNINMNILYIDDGCLKEIVQIDKNYKDRLHAIITSIKSKIKPNEVQEAHFVDDEKASEEFVFVDMKEEFVFVDAPKDQKERMQL